MDTENSAVALYHLPGLFQFYDFYRVFLPLFSTHREYFYDWCSIGSIYGAPEGCVWGGGRVECSQASPAEVLSLTQEYGISARLTFSNSLLRQEYLSDPRCNALCALFEKYQSPQNGIILHSDLLLQFLHSAYPGLYFVSSTTKVLTKFSQLQQELCREEFRYVVPDFRLNHALEPLSRLEKQQKAKVEFLCNECCPVSCTSRSACYEAVSRLNLGEPALHRCTSPNAAEGYRFSAAMKSPAFIGVEEIRKVYLPMGFTNFKLEGRGLGSALLLEFLLHYMTKPEYALQVREALYLDNTLDLF